MQADLPHTLFLHDRKEKEENKQNTVASPEVIRLQEEANRKMRERKKAKERGEIPYDNVNELFNK